MGFFFSQVAAIAETPEYRVGIRKNAKMDEGIYINVTFRSNVCRPFSLASLVSWLAFNRRQRS